MELADAELVDIIADDGKSGKSLDREGFQEVLRLLRANEADGVCVSHTLPRDSHSDQFALLVVTCMYSAAGSVTGLHRTEAAGFIEEKRPLVDSPRQHLEHGALEVVRLVGLDDRQGQEKHADNQQSAQGTHTHQGPIHGPDGCDLSSRALSLINHRAAPPASRRPWAGSDCRCAATRR